MSERFSKYISAFLLVLSAATGSCSTVSFTTVIGAPVGITGASLSLVFSISNGTAKKTFKNNEKKKTHNKIVSVARNKLNSIENIIFKPLKHNAITMQTLQKL